MRFVGGVQKLRRSLLPAVLAKLASSSQHDTTSLALRFRKSPEQPDGEEDEGEEADQAATSAESSIGLFLVHDGSLPSLRSFC